MDTKLKRLHGLDTSVLKVSNDLINQASLFRSRTSVQRFTQVQWAGHLAAIVSIIALIPLHTRQLTATHVMIV